MGGPAACGLPGAAERDARGNLRASRGRVRRDRVPARRALFRSLGPDTRTDRRTQPASAVCGELRMGIGTAPDAGAGAPGETRQHSQLPKERGPSDPEHGDIRSRASGIRRRAGRHRGGLPSRPGTFLGVIFFVLTGVMLTTAVTAFCPTYTVVGISARRGCIAYARGCAPAPRKWLIRICSRGPPRDSSQRLC